MFLRNLSSFIILGVLNVIFLGSALAQGKVNASSYCENVINSAESKKYTDKYSVILDKAAELNKLGGNLSPQKFLSNVFMRGLDDESFSRTDALVRRINRLIPKQGDSEEDLNKEIVLEQYLTWFAQCASKFKDSSLKYIFLDPGAPSDTMDKFYSSNEQEKISILRDLWKYGPMVGTRMRDQNFKERTGFQPRGINPYWVTPLLFAVTDDPGLTPVTSMAVARLDKAIADLESKIVAQRKQREDDKAKELARLAKEKEDAERTRKEAETKRLEDLAKRPATVTEEEWAIKNNEANLNAIAKLSKQNNQTLLPRSASALEIKGLTMLMPVQDAIKVIQSSLSEPGSSINKGEGCRFLDIDFNDAANFVIGDQLVSCKGVIKYMYRNEQTGSFFAIFLKGRLVYVSIEGISDSISVSEKDLMPKFFRDLADKFKVEPFLTYIGGPLGGFPRPSVHSSFLGANGEEIAFVAEMRKNNNFLTTFHYANLTFYQPEFQKKKAERTAQRNAIIEKYNKEMDAKRKSDI